MDGHFHYNLFGTEYELKKASTTLTDKAKSDEDFECLLEFLNTYGIREHYSGDTIMLSTPEVLNLNSDNFTNGEVLFYNTKTECECYGTLLSLKIELC